MAIDADTETFEQMYAGLTNHIFGPGEEGIVGRLVEGASDIPQTIGTLTYTMIEEAAKQAEQAGREFDLDILLGVATNVIDDLIRLAETEGLVEDAEDEQLREDCLMRTVETYIMTGDVSPEEKEAAQQMLAQMTDDGTYAEGEAAIADMGSRRGVDPFAGDDAESVDPAAQGMQPAPQTPAPKQLIGA